MTDAWDGRPLNPERDGWHWLRFNMTDACEPQAHEWFAGLWAFNSNLPYVALQYDYLGPCLTPAEVAAQVAAAVRAERGRCADAAHNAIHDSVYEMGECERVKSAVLDALAARPAPAGSDALAAMLAAARREGIEAAAALVECGCPAEQRALVTSVPPNSGTRWHACGQSNCAAIDAAAIRALLPAPDAALAQDFTAWTEGKSDG